MQVLALLKSSHCVLKMQSTLLTGAVKPKKVVESLERGDAALQAWLALVENSLFLSQGTPFSGWVCYPSCLSLPFCMAPSCRNDSMKKKQDFTGYDMYDLIVDKYDVPYDVQINKTVWLGKPVLCFNIMWK